MDKSVCFTGHRPNAFPWGEDTSDVRCKELLARLEVAIDQVLAQGFRHFICGNALGVDTWAAEIVIAKKAVFPDIKLEIALPYPDHNKNSVDCAKVQDGADQVHVVSQARPISKAYIERDHYMVDHSGLVIAVLDEVSRLNSGTGRTVQYAMQQGVKVNKVSLQGLI